MTVLPESASPAGQGPHILCVDDEPQLLQMLARQLRRRFRVSIAGSGDEGLELLRRQPDVAVIVSDMRMPQMDGASFLARSRELAPLAMRILLTGQADTESAISAVNSGQLFRYLTKPCAPEELQAVLIAALASYRMGVLEQLLRHQESRPVAAEGAPIEALRELFAAASGLFGASCSVLGLLPGAEAHGPALLGQGLDLALFAPAASEQLPWLAELLERDSPLRLVADGPRRPLSGLPAGHPPVNQLLATRLATPEQQVFGWLYFASGLRDGGFGIEDEAVLARLAAGCAWLYQNASLRQNHHQALLREAASRQEAERQMQRVQRGQELLRLVRSAVVGCNDCRQLLEQARRAIGTAAGYCGAWAGLLDGGGQQLLADPAGPGPAVLPLAADGGGTLSRALRDGRACCGEIGADAELAALCELGRACGAQALAVLPLRQDGGAVGALLLLAPTAEFFDEAERRLLQEIADEMGLALSQAGRSEQLTELSSYHPATLLANRRRLGERLATLMLETRHAGDRLAVVCIELRAADPGPASFADDSSAELLRAQAERLRLAAGGPDLVAHTDPECFAVILRGLAGERLPEQVRERIVEVLRRPLTVAGREALWWVRAGVAVYPDGPGGATAAESLLINAAMAMHQASAQAQPVVIYTPALGQALSERRTLLPLLHRAVANGEFCLHYQPKIDLRSGALSGCEALLRWSPAELGKVPPARFVPLLEEAGLIIEAGRWALREASAQQARWRALGLISPPVAVNVSPLQLRQPDFVEMIRELAFDEAGQPCLTLEFTESTLMADVEAGLAKLRQLRALGLAIALDDFGTGFSSLSYLAELPVTSVKLDRSFVRRIDQGEEGLAMTAGIVNLAHSRGLTVIAEGVESAGQFDQLRRLGCDEFQGFFYSPALPAERYQTLLATGRLTNEC